MGGGSYTKREVVISFVLRIENGECIIFHLFTLKILINFRSAATENDGSGLFQRWSRVGVLFHVKFSNVCGEGGGRAYTRVWVLFSLRTSLNTGVAYN